MGSLASSQAHSVSLGALGRRKLRALAAALDLSDELTAQALEVFSLMSGSWGDWAVGDSPAWPNDISDDGTPFEFSASFDGGAPRLRMLAESQTEPISEHSSWAAGLLFGQRLRDRRLADMSVFEQVQDLFAPRSGAAQGRFSLWHAAVIEEGQPALFKAYVNPCVSGPGSASYLVEQALHRLGFNDAWAFLEQCLADNSSAQIRYFSVDLAAPEEARVKVYVACAESAQAVDQLIEGARNSELGDAQRWLRTLTASQGPFDARPILSCFSFRRDLMTPDVTVHVPIRCYVKRRRGGVGSAFRTCSPRRTRGAPVAGTECGLRSAAQCWSRAFDVCASLKSREAAAVRVTVLPSLRRRTASRRAVPLRTHAPSSRFQLRSSQDFARVVKRACSTFTPKSSVRLSCCTGAAAASFNRLRSSPAHLARSPKPHLASFPTLRSGSATSFALPGSSAKPTRKLVIGWPGMQRLRVFSPGNFVPSWTRSASRRTTCRCILKSTR